MTATKDFRLVEKLLILQLKNWLMMLKRIGYILIVTMFSLMVSLFNVGATVIICSHSHNVQFAITMSDDGMSVAHACNTNNHCMQHKHLKLSLVDNAQIAKPAVSPISFDAVQNIASICIDAMYMPTHHRFKKVKPSGMHPPRAYLSLIKVLLI